MSVVRQAHQPWKECKLGDVIYSNVSSITASYPHKTIKYLDTGSITCGKIDSFQDIPLNEAPSRAKRLVKEGSIVYSTVRPIQRHYGYIKNPPENLVVSTGFSVIETKHDLADSSFIYNLLVSKDVVELFDTIAEGSTSAYPSLKPADIENLDILLPPLPEQKAIAGVLSSLDDKIDLLHRQNKTLEAMAEALFRQWFVEEADGGWEERDLDSLLEFVVDNRGKTAPLAEIGIPLIATNCIKNNNIFPVYEKVRYVSDDTYNNWFRSHPMPGDIIFVNKGTPGCVNMVPNPIDFCIAQDMIALRVDKKFISNYYLFLYLRSVDVQSQILNSSVGTTIPHLKKTDLLKFSIPVPPSSKLKDFDKIVSPIFIKMNSNYLQIRTLEKLRDTLLPKLMSGEVRVAV